MLRNPLTQLLYLFFICLALETSVSAQDMKPSQSEILAIPELNLQITYPKGKLLTEKPRYSPENKRGGSIVSIDFNVQYGGIWLQEVLFHSLESCIAFTKEYEDYLKKHPEEDNGEGFPKKWYSPDDFIDQKRIFSENTSFESINGMKFNIECSFDEPGGFHVTEIITFLGDRRIMLIIGSENRCHKTLDAVKKLISKIKFETLKP